MNADLWMGIAIGSLGSWAFLIVILAAMQTGRRNAKEGHSIANELLHERNAIGKEQVEALKTIAAWTEVEARRKRNL